MCAKEGSHASRQWHLYYGVVNSDHYESQVAHSSDSHDQFTKVSICDGLDQLG